ncbi:D-alanyl-D-alanine carboxypeptidase family protein [Sutcliffiella cohnii]
MKFSIKLMCSIILCLIPIIAKTNHAHALSAESAILMEQESGRILFEKDAYSKKRIASITKIMTAIIAVESGKLDELVKISENAEGVEGSSLYLKAGTKVKLEDLVYGMMLRSGNDAAVAIAEHVGGSLDGFCKLMNEKAKELGMESTYFSNPHGLDDHEKHYSTAYDMALLTRYAYNNPIYKKIAGTKEYKFSSKKYGDQYWRNKNRLVTGMYQYSTGGKTGYTIRAKRTLVSTANKDGMDLIAVTLNDPHDWRDHISLFNNAFNNYEMVDIVTSQLSREKKQPFTENLYVKESIRFPLTKAEKEQLRVDLNINVNEEHIDPHEPVGNFLIKIGKKEVKSVPVFMKYVPFDMNHYID